MKIAVTYENGMIFQHFGHTEQFKIFEVAENAVVRAEVVNTNGQRTERFCSPSAATILVVADGAGAGNGAAQRGHAPV